MIIKIKITKFFKEDKYMLSDDVTSSKLTRQTEYTE